MCCWEQSPSETSHICECVRACVSCRMKMQTSLSVQIWICYLIFVVPVSQTLGSFRFSVLLLIFPSPSTTSSSSYGWLTETAWRAGWKAKSSAASSYTPCLDGLSTCVRCESSISHLATRLCARMAAIHFFPLSLFQFIFHQILNENADFVEKHSVMMWERERRTVCYLLLVSVCSIRMYRMIPCRVLSGPTQLSTVRINDCRREQFFASWTRAHAAPPSSSYAWHLFLIFCSLVVSFLLSSCVGMGTERVRARAHRYRPMRMCNVFNNFSLFHSLFWD